MDRRTAALALSVTVGCGSDVTLGIGTRWNHKLGAVTAPVAEGPERRIITFLETPGANGGELTTLDQQNGQPIEGPLASVPVTNRRPLVIGTSIFITTTIGKLARVDLAGQITFTVPEGAAFGPSTPPIQGSSGIRIGTTSGQILGFGESGESQGSTQVGAPITSIATLGDKTFATTDTGRVVGVDAAGAIFFDETVDAPASGVSVSDAVLIVGEGTGVRAFELDGSEKWKHPRSARVVGTRIIDGGHVLAWGEDGRIDRIDASGTLVFSARSRPDGDANPPAIYSAPVSVEDGKIGFVDASGRASLVSAEGAVEDTLDLGAAPNGDLVQGDIGFTFFSSGDTVRAIDFSVEKQ